MAEKWTQVIEKDIALCKSAIDKNDKNLLLDVCNILLSKYSKTIDGMRDEIKEGEENYYLNVRIIKGKLEILLATIEQQETYDSLKQTSIAINASNNNSNMNSISNNISISFADTKEKIENMTSLTELEIEEALKQLKELEKIVNSKDRRSKKWENAKGIIKWIADKGVDVGISFLPLLLEIQ